MELKFGPKGYLIIDDAKIIHRNFTGAASKFNRAGDRNFSVIIPTEEMAQALTDEGWNVKIKPPRDEDDTPFMFLPVKVKYSEDNNGVKRGPTVYLDSGDNRVELDEESISCLDEIDIMRADLDIRPYDWDVNGKQGRTAYLQIIRVVQNLDRFAAERGQF